MKGSCFELCRGWFWRGFRLWALFDGGLSDCVFRLLGLLVSVCMDFLV